MMTDKQQKRTVVTDVISSREQEKQPITEGGAEDAEVDLGSLCCDLYTGRIPL